ncbi:MULTISPECIES: aminopeptidase [Atopobiaceae]|uniref:M18 family aminopeptidase n=1 Tax=Parafannyhessea umbonata TaxID=604330 RepID=A0A1H6JBA3_9ACTN|nr:MULTISPECIES: aminopeptidase [Atopobiaceae]SEH56096.1 Aspartyl aminopeptidase [Parafannyhessea umbonata]SJZ43597.1 Aspartyl aminopeptidase [Olsenella sp. KH1P3]
MQRPNAWSDYSEQQLEAVQKFAGEYRQFISDNKIEREICSASIAMARQAGYRDLAELVESGEPLKAGDKVYASNHGKGVLLVQLGTMPLAKGLNILGAHIDSPRLDVKQNPMDEKNEIVTLDTHYYGGIKKYQWVTIPLALHGVIVKTDGTVVPVTIGEAADDPVFCVSDILIHLSKDQMSKTAADAIEGEMLDVIIGNRPVKLDDKKENKTPVKTALLDLLKTNLEIEEEDFLSAELEVVPAGPARDMGLDRSMILGYGHDDSSCAYPSLVAQLECEAPQKTAVTILVDKEEIGSVGATGMTSRFFEDAMAEILELAGEGGELNLRRCLRRSRMLSSDVSAAFDPTFASVFELKNSCFMGHGLTFNKYTGSRGKSGSNDADAEYMAEIRACMDKAGVHYQTAELGKVDAGGGGTIAYILAKYGMNVIDCGVPVLSMHAPWETISKADVYEAYKGYEAFLKLA